MQTAARTIRRVCLLVCMTACVLVPCGAVLSAPPVPTLAPSDVNAEEQLVITMRGRQFEPSRIVLQAGRKTNLVLYNQDAELHAFVPGDLFIGVNLTIGGNGAPEFGERGFKRVIVPSEGRAEIRFVPERPGVYPFLCDMPGHDMKAVIVVE